MFKIYGGDTKFTQWTKNQKLIMSRLPLGAEVLFYNDPKEDEPLVTEVYEYTDENGISFHVCDVPNIFLTDTKRIKVRIPSKVVGLYGIVHSYVGQLEHYFEVEPAEKPADYVYEETTTEGCEGQIQADLSQTDSAQVDYVKGVIRQESLPEGYPYKEMATILDGTFEFTDNNGVYLHQIIDGGFTIVDGKSYTIIWDGETYQCVATIADNGFLTLGNLAIAGAGVDTGEPFLFIDQGYGKKGIGTNNTAATHTITVRGEVAYPIAFEFLPEGYPYKGRDVVLSKTTVRIETANRPVDLPYTTNFIERSLYEVVWDGITYEVVAANIENATAIGNAALANMGDDTGEPFVITSVNGRTILFAETAGSHTISIIGEIIHPMATEFLPDEYVTETELTSKGYITETELTSKGYLTSYTETDPTVPAWAKSKTKPSYDFSELTVTDPEAAKTALSIEKGMILKNLQAAMPISKHWKSVTYGNGKFVAVRSYNSTAAAYSEDGITWTATTIPSSANLYSVTYGNGKFVAVAYNSTVAVYSEDGITWTATTMPSSTYWYSVTYGNGKFVAVASGSIAAYSTDGITWTEITMPRIGNWYSVTYGGGKFVTVSYNSNIAAYSTDGITWTEITMPSSAKWCFVTYGNGKFVAVAERSTVAAYSEDGITWTATTMPSSAYWYSVTYGNGKFVAVANNLAEAAYSEDGITWTATTMPSSENWTSVTYGNGKFVAVESSSDQAAYSEDGITWKTTFEYLSQNNSDITESVRSVINKSIYETIVGVPACTTADNGKVLKVVDGVPTWVEAQ